jgi:hypothetical protein
MQLYGFFKHYKLFFCVHLLIVYAIKNFYLEPYIESFV